MSRGIGKLQREIVATLDEAREHCLSYKGGDDGIVESFGHHFTLPDDLYDLRASAKHLARKRGLRWLSGSFQAAFSRAVKGLVKRGQLEHVRSMGRQLRFVRKGKRYEPVHNAYAGGVQ